jgi:hypothetical protein
MRMQVSVNQKDKLHHASTMHRVASHAEFPLFNFMNMTAPAAAAESVYFHYGM